MGGGCGVHGNWVGGQGLYFGLAKQRVRAWVRDEGKENLGRRDGSSTLQEGGERR